MFSHDWNSPWDHSGLRETACSPSPPSAPSFNSLFQTNFPSCQDGWQITVVPMKSGVVVLSVNQPLFLAGADIQLAIVGDRLISLDVRRIVVGAGRSSGTDCGLRLGPARSPSLARSATRTGRPPPSSGAG